MERRDNSFDVVRGLAMLVIISWHVLGVHCVLTDPWVMPVFFFIAGYFWETGVPFKGFVMHKVRKLLKPLIYFSIPAFVTICISACTLQDWRPFIRVLSPYDSMVVGGWFIPCMLVTYLFYWMLDRFSASIKWRVFMAVVLSVFGYMLDEVRVLGHSAVLPFYANSALFVMVFVEMGRDFRFLLRNHAGSMPAWIGISSIIFYVLIIYTLGSKPLDMIWCNYQNAYWGVVVMESLCGVLSVLWLCKIAPPRFSSPIAYVGRQSLGFLLSHGYVIMILSFFVYNNQWLLYAMTVAVTCFFVKLIDKYVPSVLP